MGPVLINARAAARLELGGVERCAREIVARLPELRPGAYRVARPPKALVHGAGHAWEQLVLPARAIACRAALVLCPANLAPLTSRRNVVIIYDAAALRHPGWYSGVYAAWQRRVLPVIAQRARHLVTVSEFSRGELVSLLGADPGRISVIPAGVDERFSPSADAERARRALSLDRPYVLCVASRTARKNLAALGPATAALAEHGTELVAVGGDRPQFRPDGEIGGVRELGHVDDEILPSLYAGAEAFVLPSLYEGFGLTVLEAMAAGTPVVASDRTALPETCGDAALLVNPNDHDAIAAATVRAATEEGTRQRLRSAGLARASGFSWERMAASLDALLARLAGLD